MDVPRTHVAYVAVLLLLFVGGCSRVKPDPVVSEPTAAATPLATTPAPTPGKVATPVAAGTLKPAPAAVPAPSGLTTAAGTPKPAPVAVPAPSGPSTVPPAPGKVTAPVARTPAPVARAPKPAAPPAVAPPSAVASPTLDLKALTEQLRATKAIGMFTKLSLKNKVDDLLQQFREYYAGKATLTMAQLRQSYNLLMMKVLSLLQDEDQKLASAVVASREPLWSLLANPTTFAALQS